MQEYDKGKISLATKLGEMLPYFKNTYKTNITLEDLLTHESGLPGWIPLYRLLVDSTSYKGDLIKYRRSKTYSLQIDKRAWINKNFKYKKGIFSRKKGIPISKKLYLSKSMKAVLFDTIRKVEYKQVIPKEYR